MPLDNSSPNPNVGSGPGGDAANTGYGFGDQAGSTVAAPFGGLLGGFMKQFATPTPQEAQNPYGGSAGYLGAHQKYLQQHGEAAQNRSAPGMNFDQANQVLSAQKQLSGEYGNMIAGKGPTVAGLQMQQGQAAAMQGLAAQAAGARGGADNQMMAMRNAQAAGAQQMAQNNMQSGMLRANEIQNAMQGQSGLLGGMQTNQQQMQQMQAQNQMEQNKLNDQMTQGYQKNLTDMNDADINAKTGVTSANAGIQSAKSGNFLGGGVMGLVGGLI